MLEVPYYMFSIISLTFTVSKRMNVAAAMLCNASICNASRNSVKESALNLKVGRPFWSSFLGGGGVRSDRLRAVLGLLERGWLPVDN